MKDNLLYIISEKLGMNVLRNAVYLNLGKQSQKKQYRHLTSIHPFILAFGKSIVRHVALK